MKIKCESCGKLRETEQHWCYITTPDGQNIQDYDFKQLCVECSKGNYSWNLSSKYEIKGRRFVLAN